MVAQHSAVPSELVIEHIVFDELSFKRKGLERNDLGNINIQFGVAIDKLDEGKYRVSLKVTADSPDEYMLEVRLSGFCSIDENCDRKDEMLRKNAVAILFPYIRSEVTLLTAQPGVNAVVLPVLNIDATIDKIKQ